jgi:hypothetical protein
MEEKKEGRRNKELGKRRKRKRKKKKTQIEE